MLPPEATKEKKRRKFYFFWALKILAKLWAQLAKKISKTLLPVLAKFRKDLTKFLVRFGKI
jgi:hypothetical protein